MIFGPLCYAAVLVVGAILSPPIVPLHWGVNGVPDRTGDTRRWLIENAGLGVLLLLLAILVRLLVRRIPGRYMNVPHPDYWHRPEHVDEAKQITERMLSNIFNGVFLMLALLNLIAVIRADNGTLTLPTWVFGVVTVGFVGWMGWQVRCTFAAFAIPESS